MIWLIFLSSLSCEVSYTDPSADNFVFKVDGRKVAAKSNDFKSTATGATLKSDTILYVSGTNSIDGYEGVSLQIFRFTGVGTYYLSESSKNNGIYIINTYRFYTDNLNSGMVKITYIDFEPPTRIKGSFSFNVMDATTGDIYKITEGYFSLPLRIIE